MLEWRDPADRVTSLKDILASLTAAVRAGEAASDAIADHAANRCGQERG
jgi:hypothetical protein